MSNVVSINTRREQAVISGHLVNHPKCREDYRAIMKTMLEEDDYQDCLIAIMDNDYYEMLEDELQGVVSAYFSFDV